MQRGIIDRFEDDLAVIEFEDGMKDIHKSLLPKQANIGDMLVFEVVIKSQSIMKGKIN